MTKSEQLANYLIGVIAQQQLADKAKFLSVRELATQYSVSINTAQKALHTLEDQGILRAEPKKGYFVNVLKTPTQHATHVASAVNAANTASASIQSSFCPQRHLSDRATSIRQWAESVNSQASVRMDLAIGAPDFYPMQKLQQLHNRIARHTPSVFTNYAMGAGLLELRQAIAQRYTAFGCAFGTDDILVTHGATQALTLALQATTSAGDGVLIETPTYFGFLHMLDALNLNAIEVAIEAETGLTPQHVKRAIEQAHDNQITIKACLLQANFQNPTGCSIDMVHRAEILDVCFEHGIAVIEDDTFSELPHPSDKANAAWRPPPLKAHDVHHNVITCSSLSKLMAPGLRVGFISGGRWHERIKNLQHAHSIGCAVFPQEVVAAFMRHGYQHYLRKMRDTCAANTETVRQLILHHFPHGTTVSAPRGGYLLWVTLPETVFADELLEQALQQHGIAFAPGQLFSGTLAYRHSLRVNCASADELLSCEAIPRLGQLVTQIQAQKPLT